jgi:regulator of sigma E protease
MSSFVMGGIIVLGILIFIHELGHFLAAKRLRVGVEKFSLGFGPKLIGKRIGETEYMISAVPLGGYVKLVGEDPKEPVLDPEKDFSAKPVWTRMKIILAGPMFNLFFAFIVFSGIYMVGMPRYSSLPVVGQIQEKSPAMQAGLQPGDRIISINQQKITKWQEMADFIHAHPGKEVVLQIQRGSDTLVLPIIPESKKVVDESGEEITIGLIGISPSLEFQKYNPFMAVIKGLEETWTITELIIVSIAKIIMNKIPAKTIGGPILIFQLAGEVFKVGIITLLRFTALISINLAILNLLPIPILDGGHMVFLLLELVRGKPISIKRREIAQHIGMALIISIMLFAFYNDIIRIFEK